ncbi:hypothetical protein JTE90_001758 [Oedothorax gibbosus]|uniref:Dynein regulatory complex protein 1/2 N-terminal domain-containing protein n=1 Tax=Oedothorax gibbosus TaxID=931172 RepID=A0AAV6VRT6_9ARAC|nr:hypothetical protein JTE90_001758 [Oedothorax gibbosus]
MDDHHSSEESGGSKELLNVEEIRNSKNQMLQDEEKKLDTPQNEASPAERLPEELEEVAKDDTISQRTEADTLDDVSSKSKSELLEEEEIRKEEERRKRMKVLLTGYLELKTKKETERAILNEKKITSQWLYPFRGAYQKEWELDMKKLKSSFQRALDYKKSHIHAIQRERKLVELNHLWADSAHQRISEELFDFMRIRCDALKTGYLQELEETKKYYLEREREIVDRFSKAEERAKVLRLLRKTVREKTLQKTREALLGYKHQGELLKAREMDDIKEKHLTYVEAIAQELQSSVSPPEHRMDEIRSLFDEWKGKYEDFLKVSEKNRKEMEQLGEELPGLEAKLTTAKKTLDDLRAENKETKRRQAEEIARLQNKAKKCELVGPSMRKMISESEEVMVKLRERKEKLGKIVKLHQICERLETDSVNMLPKGGFIGEGKEKRFVNSDDENLEKVEGLNCLEENETDCQKLVKDLCSEDPGDPKLLSNLHRKLARMKMQNLYLQHDIDNLRIEGMALRSDMKKFLSLIASGEWERIPDSKLEEFGEEGERFHKDDCAVEGDDSVERNLRLLDRKCGEMNKKIIKRAENM